MRAWSNTGREMLNRIQRENFSRLIELSKYIGSTRAAREAVQSYQKAILR